MTGLGGFTYRGEQSCWKGLERWHDSARKCSAGPGKEGRAASLTIADILPAHTGSTAGPGAKPVPGPVFEIRALQLRTENAFGAWVLIPRCPGQVRQSGPPELGG